MLFIFLLFVPAVSRGLQAVPSTHKNGWNPGGQGEGYGEPARTETGGDYRYSAGRNPGDFDWHKYAGGSESPKAAEQRLLFNVSVSGRDLEVVSSFGGGSGSQQRLGGGGGGQHSIRLRKGRVVLMGGFDGDE